MAFAETFHSPTQEGIFLMRSSHSLDAVAVMFDDDHAVANAGLVLPATVAHLTIPGRLTHSMRSSASRTSSTPWVKTQSGSGSPESSTPRLR